jgi:hypothetical protein
MALNFLALLCQTQSHAAHALQKLEASGQASAK